MISRLMKDLVSVPRGAHLRGAVSLKHDEIVNEIGRLPETTAQLKAQAG